MLYLTASGFNQAGCCLVGQCIGKEDVTEAKKYYFQTLKTAVPFFFVVTAVLLASGRQVMFLLTDEEPVIDLVMTALYIQLIGAFIDMTLATLTGIVRALGLQNQAMYIMLFGNYCLALPFTWFFAFYLGKGYRALWASSLIGIGFNTISLLVLIQFSDWNKAVVAYKERLRLEEERRSFLSKQK